MVSITVYDGAATIGGNKIYLEFDGNGIFFDFGMNYKKMADFYEEFLKPRSSRGIHDLLFLDIIPNIKNYRSELIPSDVNLSSALDLKVDAVLLSHAHMDHIGNVGLLDLSIPIVTSPVSAAIIKAMRDCGGEMESEVAYVAPREVFKEDNRMIKTSDYRNKCFFSRKFLIAGEYDRNLKDFWGTCIGGRGLQAEELKPATENLDFEFKSFEVDHSIYGATAYAINTSVGWIVYTGDLRVNGIFKEKTERFVKEAHSLAPNVLITEGTRISRPERSESEEIVYETCLNVAQDEAGLLIADFSPRNFERLDTFLEISKKVGRQLVVLSKDAYMLEAMKCADSRDRMSDLLIYSDLKLKKGSYEKQIHEKFKDKLIDPSEVAKAPENYILCFSFWDMKQLLDIKPEKGTYIYSSSEAYSEEQVIDFLRLWNWIKFFHLKVRGFNITDINGKVQPEFEEGFHASGHASASELLKIVEEINPKIVLPVHTENPELFTERLQDYTVILPENGKKIEI